MDTHFTWRIDYLKKYRSFDNSITTYNDIVYHVGYTCTGINTSGILTTQSSRGANVGLNTSRVGLDEVPVAYSNITEDLVIQWVKGIDTEIESSIDGDIMGGDDTIIEIMPWD